ncbi:YkgJ family cysteine cluster protein [Aeromonas enteropelogenes]|uniref:YkgJ family cysteine cluster protein n=1 Tax=Aeromonas enteropelogenes TaxID=29489 RepID=UPI003BA26B38
MSQHIHSPSPLIEVKQVQSASVPCHGCTLCCRGDAISIHPELGDDASRYQTVPHCIPQLAAKGIVMLAHKPDESCVYLGEGGCTIHGQAPALCREFDCRGLVRKLGYTNARKAIKKGMLSAGFVRRGIELLKKEGKS